MRILKFGGTSVANAHRILDVGSIIRDSVTEDRSIVVVSALAGVTDQLIELTEAVAHSNPTWRGLLDDLRQRHFECLDRIPGVSETDACKRTLVERLEELEILCSGIELVGNCGIEVRERLLAAGERLSAQIVAASLRSLNLEAEAVDAADLIRVSGSRERTTVDIDATTRLVRRWLENWDPSVIPVVTGFVAGDRAGHTCTLGRGGSDLSASILAAAAAATRVEIWTDVDGVLTGPPQQIADTKPIPRLSYEEASEMAFFGAAVLHRDTLAPLVELGIPVWVRNTMAPEVEGTIVSAFRAKQGGATAVAAVAETTVHTFQNRYRSQSPDSSRTLGRIFAAVQPEALITSQASSDQELTVIVPRQRSDHVTNLARPHLGGNGTEVEWRSDDDTCVIAVVGHDLQKQPRVIARALDALDQHGIEPLASASSRHSFTFALDAKVLHRALDALHTTLLRSQPVATKETHDVHEEKGRYSRRYRQCRPAVRSSVA